MYILLAIVIIGVTMGLVWSFYMKWVGVNENPKHHKNDDYIDESFKMNFIEKKVKDKK